MKLERIVIPTLTTAQRAILKRCVGKPLAEAGRAMGIMYASIPADVERWQEEQYFMILCMSCLWKEEERGEVHPMEECLRRIRLTDSLDRRVLALLDIDLDGNGNLLNTKLSRLVRQIHSSAERISPDFPQLYEDLLQWDNDNRIIQKKWARVYFKNLVNNQENERKGEEYNVV